MNAYGKSLYLVAAVISVTVALYSFPSDDGLRHVGVAFSDFSSWGEVYPYSMFEKFSGYDPWYGYDLTLRWVARAAEYLPGSAIATKVCIVKAVSLLFLSVFLLLILERSGLPGAVKDRDGFTLSVIFLTALLFFPIKRIALIRPFAFGTFYLLYSVGRKGWHNGALSSLILTFFYPYLSWFYILPAAFGHRLKGDRRFAGGAALFILLFAAVQPPSFWGFQVELFRSAGVRETIDLSISEFVPTWRYISFYVYLATFLILFPLLAAPAKRLNYTSLLMLIYLYPAMKHVRYFIDIMLPLALTCFGRGMLDLLLTPYGRWIELWKRTARDQWKKIRSVLPMRASEKGNGPDAAEKRDTNLKPYLAAGYLMLMVLLALASAKQVSKLRSFQEGLASIPRNALVLSSFNLQYKTLFLRPDIRLIPSCELGFASGHIFEEYADFFNNGLISPLSSKTGAGYFLGNRKTYISPQEGTYLGMSQKTEQFSLWTVSISTITHTEIRTPGERDSSFSTKKWIR